MKEETPRDTSEDLGDENQGSKTGGNPALKDRKCQYCQQAFTSSSLGRHLDQFLFKKKPDGVHDVEEIRRIRSESAFKPRDPSVRMMFNTPTWHATGVINDIPNPSRALDGPRQPPSQSRTASLQLPDYASRGATANNPDTMKALELALREVLDNIKAATSRACPPLSPFDIDIQAQTFPSLCLQLLPPPPSLFASHPFPSPSSFPLQPPGAEHLDIVRQALHSKIAQWQADQIAADSSTPLHARPSNSSPPTPGDFLRSLDFLPLETRNDAWKLELTRAFAREAEKRKSLDEQLVRVQQEANQLRAQVERLGSCQWPREFALFPPDTLPLPRDVARELDGKDSHISADSSRWDYDNVVAKWRRVVMHDKGMGRIGVGYANNSPLMDSDQSLRHSPDVRPSRPGEDTSAHPNRLRPLQSAPAMSPDPATASTPASSTHYASPYSHADPRSPPSAGASGAPQAKRPRLMNGSESQPGALSDAGSAKSTWPSSTPALSNLTAPSGQTPPSSARR
ncbi:hypothetical protein NUU61_009896 [Penicillium alfredii]|uniref:Uncharacterized protein n=1 Tax=Penicillium alfredii TaxID=1506179 RepID=A0A9W9JUG6_9EURO|nr:uncharacterized protein NUU61_009896 [Penicillium alfredii]KAJ5081632.1 hypothetical protein NUU61_009896 [Penicillium alfredii]